jgi:hypothetical protein
MNLKLANGPLKQVRPRAALTHGSSTILPISRGLEP